MSRLCRMLLATLAANNTSPHRFSLAELFQSAKEPMHNKGCVK